MKTTQIEKLAPTLYRWQIWINGELDDQGFAETKAAARWELTIR